MLRYLNLSLLIIFPIAWCAPLLRAGLLPFFDLDTISVLSAVQSLWGQDIFLASVVAFFAVIAPYGKVLALAAVDFGAVPARIMPWLQLLGRLAMADIFLIAFYIVIAKGTGIGRIETGWGLYLLTACVLASIALSHYPRRQNRAE